MAIQVLNVLDKGWPFAASVLAGVFAFGSLHSDVTDLKQAQSTAQSDHDAIVRLDQGQKDMRQDLKDIKDSLGRIEHK
jgi:hypothetical protein